MTYLALCLGVLAIFFFLAYDAQRVALQHLCDSTEAHQEATKELLRYVDGLESYCAALESANRYNRAVAAGFILSVGAIDVAEKMMMEGENVP